MDIQKQKEILAILQQLKQEKETLNRQNILLKQENEKLIYQNKLLINKIKDNQSSNNMVSFNKQQQVDTRNNIAGIPNLNQKFNNMKPTSDMNSENTNLEESLFSDDPSVVNVSSETMPIGSDLNLVEDESDGKKSKKKKKIDLFDIVLILIIVILLAVQIYLIVT